MTDTPSTRIASTDTVAAEGLPTLTRRRAAQLFRDESGAATAEYAIATMATVARTRHT